MLFEEKRKVRKLAVSWIKQARQRAANADEPDIQRFIVPPIRFHAADYMDLIPW